MKILSDKDLEYLQNINTKTLPTVDKDKGDKNYPGLNCKMKLDLTQFIKDVRFETIIQLFADAFGHDRKNLISAHFMIYEFGMGASVHTDPLRGSTLITLLQSSKNMIGGDLKVLNQIVDLKVGHTYNLEPSQPHEVTLVKSKDSLRQTLVLWFGVPISNLD